MRQGTPSFTVVSAARAALDAQQALVNITAAQGLNDQGLQRYSIVSEEVTTTTYTFVAADNGKQKIFTAATAITATLPSGLPAGFNCLVAQSAAGQVTVAAGGSVTVVNRQSQFKTAGQHAVISILPRLTTNDYRILGDTAA